MIWQRADQWKEPFSSAARLYLLQRIGLRAGLSGRSAAAVNYHDAIGKIRCEVAYKRASISSLRLPGIFTPQSIPKDNLEASNSRSQVYVLGTFSDG